jgi:hypothetical protein
VEQVATAYVLVHAPVLGPASWMPVAAELSGGGCLVAVPSLTDFAAGGPPYAAALIRLCADQARMAMRPATAERAADHVVLVVHSGAGPLAAHIAAAVRAGEANPAEVMVVFADAGLPSESGATPVVDGGFLPYLREIARDGVVPPWDQWWPGAEPSELFPSEAARDAVLADTRPLPLAFFEESLPGGPAVWRAVRQAAYLLFSDAYRQEGDEARRRGWPVTELAGSHLHPLARPAEVASAIIGLAERLGTA